MEQAHAPRARYAREMGELEHELLEMVSRAEIMVTKAVDALQRLDGGLAKEVMDLDDEIDLAEIQIETRCLRLLALEQPLAGDLREVGTVVKVVTDVERIGDLAVDIAKICLKVESELGATDYVDIPLMSNAARQMLREAAQMFVRKDVAALDEIEALEDQVDDLYRSIRSQIFDYMIKNPDQVVSAGWLLLAIHHIERLADHALNIAERVYFMVTGERVARGVG